MSSKPTSRPRTRRPGDALLGFAARGSALCILGMLAALGVVLLLSALPSLRTFGPEFLTSTDWRPNEITRPVVDAAGNETEEILPPSFGGLPVIYGTVVSSVIALVVAVPLSLGAALFLVRVAPRLRLAGVLLFLVEFLAAIPSIAFGIWGLFVLAPFLQNVIEPGAKSLLGGVPGFAWLCTTTITIGDEVFTRPVPLTGRDMLCGGLILGIMVLPIITAVSRDVLRAVPRMQIEGTLALGATWWQSCAAMLRYGRAGLFGAIMLGLARAAGETMAVAMVIGNNNQVEASPFAPAQTMSSLLANEFAEASDGLHRAALLEVALILLVMSLVINVIARSFIVGRGSRTAAAH